MASGRVGGTKSKKSGQVGTNIYQIRKNDDGSYSQIVTIKGVTTVNRTTPRLQAQRMCTAMVEHMMKQLAPVAKISMQAAANKSKSLNAFSSYNLQLVARDCQANWYGNNRFQYPLRSFAEVNEYWNDGFYLISAGTLQYNLFDNYLDADWAYDAGYRVGGVSRGLYGVEFSVQLNRETIAQFLRRHRFAVMDKFVFVGYRYWYEDNEEEEETIEHRSYDYYIASLNYNLDPSLIMTPEVISNLFLFESNNTPSVHIKQDGSKFCVGIVTEGYLMTEYFGYTAAFSISQYDGRKKISSSSLHAVSRWSPGDFNSDAPTKVFGSWIGEPWNQNYPTIF